MQLVCALILQAALQPIPAPVPSPPTLETIEFAMNYRLERDARRQIRSGSWVKERTDEDISKPSKPKIEHREEYAVWGDGLQMLQRKTRRDGELVKADAEPLPFFIDPALMSRFQFSLAEPMEVPCDDHLCWRLSFAPKPNQSDDTGDDDRKMFASSIGTLVINKDTYGIVRIEGHMAVPYRTWLYTVNWSSVTITQEMYGDTMVVATIEMSYSYSTFFSSKTKRRFYRTVGVSLPPS